MAGRTESTVAIGGDALATESALIATEGVLTDEGEGDQTVVGITAEETCLIRSEALRNKDAHVDCISP